uniref:Valine--tRNA ligase, mitochondrial n=1 Tax=Denticeps clupeoides TaxID=299321 RepID=A0AAY4C0H6_9TELE
MRNASLVPRTMWRSRCGPLGVTAGFTGRCRRHSGTSSPPTRTRAEKDRRRREREECDKCACFLLFEPLLYLLDTTSVPFPQSYSPEYVESGWYQWWEKEGFFTPEYHVRTILPHAASRTFSLCIPPPNVTGTLHLGHALTVAIQDSLARWRRMLGCKVLWVPGCDHAGIATQSVVERRLLREHGKHRQDYGREEFLREVWKWKNEKGDEIYHQLRKLGASLDWSRACFTMDEGFSRAVTEAFVRLCDSGLIYRSEALVNWSCALGSAISDVEVEMKQLTGRTLLSVPGYEKRIEFGTMVTFAYPLEEGEVSVSTTRPETILGDVAIAVHPEDPRYKDLHGRACRHPFTERLLPIIADALVDKELGTGAVKVTPAHDHTDFLLSQRHSLPHLTVIGGDGHMTSLCGQWLEGVRRFDARERVMEALMEKKMFRGRRDHPMSLPVCSRSGDVIEPLLRKQWFVRCGEMAGKAVDDGELEIIPSFYTKTWRNWLSNISDWCISRQLWWGHQIPAYRVSVSLAAFCPLEEELWTWGRTEEEARQRAVTKFKTLPSDITLSQDTDVLDTWFSSGLFPFAMLGWPRKTPDLAQFYPNTILETGSDLIFFWVARMVMLEPKLGITVLLHSLVRDKHGRKMSKSLGNVIDPLDVISGVSLERLQEKVKEGNLDPRETTVAMEAQRKDFPKGIPECGADAMRFALCSHKIHDINLSVSQVLSCRHFCNKMWQTVKFTLGALENSGSPLGTTAEISPLSSIDRWICSQLYSTVLQCERGFENYELHSVTSTLQSFWVHSLCDVYLECVKPVLAAGNGAEDGEVQRARQILFHCVSVSLALLSPFMPYLTEELWQRLQPHGGTADPSTSLCVQGYPQSSQLEEAEFPLVQEVARVTRSLRAQCHMTRERPDCEFKSECCEKII